MKKRYVEPQIDVQELCKLQLLSGSDKGVYGTIDGEKGIGYRGFADDDEDPD